MAKRVLRVPGRWVFGLADSFRADWNNGVRVQARMNRLYVGNVDYALTDAQLRCAMEKLYGPVLYCKICRSGKRPRGFAFVEFERTEDTLAALDEREVLISDRVVTIAQQTRKAPKAAKNEPAEEDVDCALQQLEIQK